MTENDLTIKILQGIRDDLQRSNRDSNARFEAITAEQAAARLESNQRFEVIESALRDVAEQLVMLSRVAELEQRAH